MLILRSGCLRRESMRMLAMKDAPKHRILVVDDEPLIRETMSFLLAAQGYEVATATDGFEALLQLLVKPSDLLISDLNMPHMSGFELLSIVRQQFPELPVIAISGAYEYSVKVPSPKGKIKITYTRQTMRHFAVLPPHRSLSSNRIASSQVHSVFGVLKIIWIAAILAIAIGTIHAQPSGVPSPPSTHPA